MYNTSGASILINSQGTRYVNIYNNIQIVLFT